MRRNPMTKWVLIGLAAGFLVKVIEDNFPAAQAKFVTLFTPGRVPLNFPFPIGWNDLFYISVGLLVALRRPTLGVAIIGGWLIHQLAANYMGWDRMQTKIFGIRL